VKNTKEILKKIKESQEREKQGEGAHREDILL